MMVITVFSTLTILFPLSNAYRRFAHQIADAALAHSSNSIPPPNSLVETSPPKLLLRDSSGGASKCRTTDNSTAEHGWWVNSDPHISAVLDPFEFGISGNERTVLNVCRVLLELGHFVDLIFLHTSVCQDLNCVRAVAVKLSLDDAISWGRVRLRIVSSESRGHHPRRFVRVVKTEVDPNISEWPGVWGHDTPLEKLHGLASKSEWARSLRPRGYESWYNVFFATGRSVVPRFTPAGLINIYQCEIPLDGTRPIGGTKSLEELGAPLAADHRAPQRQGKLNQKVAPPPHDAIVKIKAELELIGAYDTVWLTSNFMYERYTQFLARQLETLRMAVTSSPLIPQLPKEETDALVRLLAAFPGCLATPVVFFPPVDMPAVRSGAHMTEAAIENEDSIVLLHGKSCALEAIRTFSTSCERGTGRRFRVLDIIWDSSDAGDHWRNQSEEPGTEVQIAAAVLSHGQCRVNVHRSIREELRHKILMNAHVVWSCIGWSAVDDPSTCGPFHTEAVTTMAGGAIPILFDRCGLRELANPLFGGGMGSATVCNGTSCVVSATDRLLDMPRELLQQWQAVTTAHVCTSFSFDTFQSHFHALILPMQIPLPNHHPRYWHLHVAAAQAYATLRPRVCCIGQSVVSPPPKTQRPSDVVAPNEKLVALYFDTRIDAFLQTHVQLLKCLLGPEWTFHFVHAQENEQLVRDVAMRALPDGRARFTLVNDLLPRQKNSLDLSFDPSAPAALARRRHLNATETTSGASSTEQEEGYNALWKSLKFWDALASQGARKILVWQADTFEMARFDRRWLAYDYLGAPWCAEGRHRNGIYLDPGERSAQQQAVLGETPQLEKHCRVGNGGLSLRDTQAAIRSIETSSSEVLASSTNEDVIFASSACHGGEYPPLDVAERFSVESLCPDLEMTGMLNQRQTPRPPFGVHKPWKYLDTRVFEAWQAQLSKELTSSSDNNRQRCVAGADVPASRLIPGI